MGRIGVFDSGVGGLSVLREIRRELPHETILYVADSAHAPYGEKSADFVVERSQLITDFLIHQGATSLVVACNTATAVAIDTLRARYPLPIVGVEPAVKPAVRITQTGVIGVLTTSRTALSARLDHLLARHGGGARIVVEPCQGWVEVVERGAADGAEAGDLVARHVTPILEQGADVLVLGCTHYAFLATAIRRLAGDRVALLDPAPAVARHLHQRLRQEGLLSSQPDAAEHYWTSAPGDHVAAVMSKILGRQVPVAQLR